MAQRFATLTGFGQGYAPLAEGIDPDVRTGYEGIPFLGQAAMAAIPYLGGANPMASARMIPMGVGNDQNLYDVMRAMQFQRMQIQSMQAAADADRMGFMRTFGGAFVAAGVPFGHEQRQMAGSWANALVAAAPLAAQFAPDLLDQLGGSRGSATVMAQRMALAGRYRLDPITGQMGMSAESTGAQARSLFQDLYNDANIAQMQGVTAGQLGSLQAELQKRGMLRGAAAEMPTAAGFRGGDPRGGVMRAAQLLHGTGDLDIAARRQGVDISHGAAGLSGADLDKLAIDPAVADKLRSFDAERVKRSLRNYTGAVAAMRDIFGDMGRPGAPMSELIQGLEQLTAGSMNQIDPGRLGAMVRQTYALAKQTGVSMDAALMMQGHAAQLGERLGLEPIFSVNATQGALAFGGAYRAQGHAAFGAWGLMGADQLQQLDMNLRMQAAASPAANRLGAAMKLRDTLGGFQDSKGQMRSVNLEEGEYLRMLTSAKGARGQELGLTDSYVREFVNQRDSGAEIEKYKIDSVVRRTQGRDEVLPFVGGVLQGTIRNRLRDALAGAGVANADELARAASGAIGQRANRRIYALSDEEFRDDQLRNQGMARIIQEELAGTDAGKALAALPEDRRQAFLLGTASLAHGATNRALRNSPWRAFKNAFNLHAAVSLDVLNGADQQQLQAANDSAIAQSLTSLGQGTMLRRAVDALQGARADDPDAVRKILMRTVGGVPQAELEAALVGPAQRLVGQRKAIDDLMTKVAAAPNQEAKSELITQLEAATRALTNTVNEMADAGKRLGLAVKDVGADEIRRTTTSGRDLLAMQSDLAALRTGAAGSDVSDSTVNALMARRGRASEADTMAVLLFRRRQEVERLRNDPAAAAADPRLRSLVESIGKAQPGIGLEAAREQALKQLDEQAANFTDRASQDLVARTSRDLRIESAEEARVLERARRRRAPGAASPEEVHAAMLANGDPRRGILEHQAATLVNTRHLAERLGITAEEIAEQRTEDRTLGTRDAWKGEIRAIEALVAQRQRNEYTVTDAAREAAQAASPVTQAQRDDLIKSDPRFRGAPIGALDQAVLDRRILGERAASRRGRFDAFWKTEDGARFRETVATARKDVDALAQRLIVGPELTRKLGSRAIDLHDELTGGQQRLADLAAEHAGGDVGRLLAGDLNPNVADPVAVMEESFAIQRRQREVQEELGRSTGTDRAWRGDRDEAMSLLGIRPGTTPSAAQEKELAALARDVAVARKITPEQESVARGKDAAGIARLAASLGTDVAGVGRGVGVLDRVDRRRESRLRAATVAGATVAGKLLSAYGLERPDGLVTAKQRELGALIEGPGGRGLAERMLTTRADLERFASRAGDKGQSGVDRLAGAYEEAIGKKDPNERRQAVAAFQRRYGLEQKDGHLTAAGQDQWQELQKAIRFQKQKGLLGRKITSDADLLNIYGAAARGEQEPRHAGGGGGGPAGPQKISGTLEIIGRQGNLVADMGGTRGAITG